MAKDKLRIWNTVIGRDHLRKGSAGKESGTDILNYMKLGELKKFDGGSEIQVIKTYPLGVFLERIMRKSTLFSASALEDVLADKSNKFDDEMLPINIDVINSAVEAVTDINYGNFTSLRAVLSQCESAVPPEFGKLEEYVRQAAVATVIQSVMKKKADPKMYQLKADYRIPRKPHGLHFGQRVILDGDYAFELAVGYDPVCVVGFYLENGGLNIRQIQGVKGQKLRLRDFKHFEDALVLIAEDYARQTKLSEVSIRPAAENGWVRAGKISLERAVDHYDRTAERNEYVYDKERKLFVKQLA